MTDYLTVVEVLAIHTTRSSAMVARIGVRDRGLLEAALYTFLAINEIQLTATASEIEIFLVNLYETGSFNFERLSEWLRSNVRF